MVDLEFPDFPLPLLSTMCAVLSHFDIFRVVFAARQIKGKPVRSRCGPATVTGNETSRAIVRFG